MQIEGERLYLFIDETGDPGHPDKEGSSSYYQLNIIVTGREGLEKLTQHLSAFRYFRRADKELKRYERQAFQIRDVFKWLADSRLVSFYSFCIDKKKYIGPYLRRINRNKNDYDPKKFRNFIVRMSLEKLFKNKPYLTSVSEIELIFDRYLENEDDQINLAAYLRGNYKLPNFFHILQVDSEYSDPVQAADYLGRLVKDHYVDGKDSDVSNFVKIFDLSDPDCVKEKHPATLE
jgi:hypothetical protein